MSATFREKSVDRLSALPDGILCYILSFLEMSEAAITCLLSKRWQFLWTELPVLQFKENYVGNLEEKRKFVLRVHMTLAICRRHNLERFEVDFTEYYNKCFDFDVDVWIRFAVKNKVKEFFVLLPEHYNDYLLPQMMYSNPSWTYLSLRGCIMAPRQTIQWQSLTRLCMCYVELNEHTFEEIFSGCPVLSSLDIWYCRGFNRLEVNSPSLRTLSIADNDGGHLKISAPCIQTFSIDLESRYRKLSFENLESLVRAEIKLDDIDEWNRKAANLWKKRIKQLFGSIRHIKMLKLGCGSIQLLSLIARNWRLPQSTTRCLAMHGTPDKSGIAGIALILESSPNLETLVIHGCNCYTGSWPTPSNPDSKYDLDCDLPHLKTVCFRNFGDPSRDNGEPILTLAQILLKRAVILEKLVVNFQGFTATSSTAICEMGQKLLNYPRLSQKAVFLLC